MSTSERPRRKPGEGSIRPYQTAEGERFLICYRFRDPMTGKSRQKLERGFKTQRKATEALRDRMVKIDKGQYVEPSKQPLGEYLTEWVNGLRLAESTVASYGRNIREHVIPRIGGTPLVGVTSTALSAFYRDLESDGGRRDGRPGGLSARTVRYIHTIVHSALKEAVDNGRLPVNPADRAKPPTARQAASPEMHTWEAEELRAFLDWSSKDDNDDLHIAWRLLGMTGMRRGEGLAMQWGDIDFEAGTLSVRRAVGIIRDRGQAERIITGPTKSGKARVIDVDPTTLAKLKAYRKERGTLDLRLAREPAFVIANVDGTPRHPERFSREFVRRLERCQRALGDAAMPTIRLHDLRHTHATILLRAGVHPKIVSERLGHAKTSITMDVYSHAVPTLQREAAEKLAALVYGESP